MRHSLQASAPEEPNPLASSVISNAHFYLAGAVVDKLRLYLADRETDFYLAGLSAVLTPICEYLLSLKGRLAVYMPQSDKSPIRSAFDRLRSDGDAARQAEFFQSCLATLHFESEDRWVGLKLAHVYAQSVVASILGERVEALYSGPSDSQYIRQIETRWLSNQLIGSRYGQVLVK